MIYSQKNSALLCFLGGFGVGILVFSYKKRPTQSSIDPFHIVISLSNRSSIEKSIKPFLKMKGQIAY